MDRATISRLEGIIQDNPPAASEPGPAWLPQLGARHYIDDSGYLPIKLGIDFEMGQFTTVAKVGSIPEGEGATFPLGDRLVAVFHHRGRYFAIDDLCPHMGASLGAGQLDDEGKVTCPWHAWRFDICDGTWCDNPRLKIDAFEVRVHGDEIQVAVRQSQSDDLPTAEDGDQTASG